MNTSITTRHVELLADVITEPSVTLSPERPAARSISELPHNRTRERPTRRRPDIENYARSTPSVPWSDAQAVLARYARLQNDLLDRWAAKDELSTAERLVG